MVRGNLIRQRHAELLRIIRRFNRCQRVILRMSDSLGSRGDALEQQFLFVGSLAVNFCDGRVIRRGNIRAGFICFVFIDQFIKRLAALALLVQLFDVFIQFGSDSGDLVRLVLVGLGGLSLCHLRSLSQLLKDGLLLCLVGMKLQAEVADSDLVKSAFHHLESRHFFRDKKHGFALRKRVGDQGGDGLGLACSGRTVQHKALAL